MTAILAPQMLDLGFVEMRQRGDARAIALPHHPRAVAAARRTLVEDIESQLEHVVIQESELIASELLANSVRHAHPLDDHRVMLRWQVRAGVLDLEVTDGGSPGEVRPQRPAPLAQHGRGLRIVRALAHEWGVFEDSDGRRTVWACLGGPSRRRHRW